MQAIPKLLILVFFALSLSFIAKSQSYTATLNSIKKDRISMIENKISNDSIKAYLTEQFITNIFPKWIGTTWDYNGYTNIPKKGAIACGYFVSTPLKHIGFNWNRFKLAQMYSKKIIEKTCGNFIVFKTKKKLNTYMETQENGIYIIGLSSHVGYIIKHKNKSWFVHSNYFDNEGPIKENILSSEAIDNSEAYWLGKFTTNKNVDMWLNSIRYDW